MPTVVLLLLALASPLGAQQKWPASFQSPQPKIHQLPKQEEVSAWETAHFVLVCEKELPPQRLLDFARVIESVPNLFKGLPLPLWAPPEDDKPVIRICQNETSFVARGGPPGAAGYYHGRQATVLLRGDLLLKPPQANPTSLRSVPDGDLLIHELCHLAMHQLGTLPPWLAEGIAEYFASCHFGNGRYRFTDTKQTIPQHIRKFYPQNRFPTLVLPSPSEVASISSKEWIRSNNLADPEDRYRPYATALLLAHYYLEGGTQRRQELANFLEQRVTNKGNVKPNLLDTVPEDLDKKLTRFWKTQGLAISFENTQ